MKIVMFVIVILLAPVLAFAQAENVPVSHPVYTFLKRLEVKGLLDRYHDAILPLSRKEVAGFLRGADSKRGALSESECGWLADFLNEFQYDLTGSTAGFHSVIEPLDSLGVIEGQLSQHEKFLYALADSNISFFVNGLFDADTRQINGDALGKEKASYLQLGGRVRGTIWGKLGFSGTATNAAFWGSRELLARDGQINQSHEVKVTDTQNFDYTEGYVRYDANIVSLQLGRERILWGNGYDQKMILSDNIRPYDFIRFDAQYKSLKYTFLHAWLLGTSSQLTFTLPSDTSAKFSEPLNADKYFAAHRIELSIPGLFDIGFQEMYIYSNRSVDLAYLNPFVLMESVQRSRGERDNGFWTFDIQTHFLKGIEFHATMLYDDINVPYLFSNAWNDRYAWQSGMMYVDPFGMPNTSIAVEYTRVEPYVFSHGRSRDDSYTSLGRTLGTRIGPNSDAWFFGFQYLPLRNLFLSARVSFERTGENVVASDGTLIKNVGGDVLQPHRDSDPFEKKFLDGIRVNTRRVQLLASWQFVRQMWLDLRYEFDSRETLVTGAREENNLVVFHIRTEF